MLDGRPALWVTCITCIYTCTLRSSRAYLSENAVMGY